MPQDFHHLAGLVIPQRPLQLSLPEAGGTHHIEQPDARWEQSIPSLKDPARLPDPSTLRRWAARRLISLWSWVRTGLWKLIGWRFLTAPTILAWDCPAFCRILRIEAGSP